MMTAALIEDHQALCALFTKIEELLPSLNRTTAVKELARQVEGLLRKHAAAEEDLVLLALAAKPEHQSAADAFYQEHQEIDGRLVKVSTTLDFAQARQLLQEAIARSRQHFQYEESFLFPLLERVSERETLFKLGRLWRKQRGNGWPSNPSPGAAGLGIERAADI